MRSIPLLHGCGASAETPYRVAMMWTRTRRETLEVEPSQLWGLIADMRGWSRWDPDVASIELHGPLAHGSRGDLVPTGRVRGAVHRRGAGSFTIGSYEAGSSLRMDQPIPLGSMTVRLSVAANGDGRSELTQDVCLTGPFARVMVRVIGNDIVTAFPDKCLALQRLASREST
jgi:hypothetical protein